MVFIIGGLFRSVVAFLINKVEGLENLPKDTPFVIAANHDSFIDVFILGVEITRYLKKKKIYVISAMFFFFDVLASVLFSEFGGSIRLRKKVHGGFLKSAIRKLRKKDIVCMFPEGVPSKKAGLRRGKSGVARLVLKAKVPVVPIGIQGTMRIWSKRKWIPSLNKKVTIKIGKPLYFDRYYGKDEDYPTLRKVTTVIMKQIGSLIGREYNF